MKQEVARFHPYLTIFNLADNGSLDGKATAIVHLLTVQSALMFLMAVFLDLESPADDGQCSTYSTEKQCLAPTSMFDHNSNMCSWEFSASDGEFSCEYVEVKSSWKVIVLVSILIGSFSAPVELVVNYIFDE
jgi:hypothetical protein